MHLHTARWRTRCCLSCAARQGLPTAGLACCLAAATTAATAGQTAVFSTSPPGGLTTQGNMGKKCVVMLLPRCQAATVRPYGSLPCVTIPCHSCAKWTALLRQSCTRTAMCPQLWPSRCSMEAAPAHLKLVSRRCSCANVVVRARTQEVHEYSHALRNWRRTDAVSACSSCGLCLCMHGSACLALG